MFVVEVRGGDFQGRGDGDGMWSIWKTGQGVAAKGLRRPLERWRLSAGLFCHWTAWCVEGNRYGRSILRRAGCNVVRKV